MMRHRFSAIFLSLYAFSCLAARAEAPAFSVQGRLTEDGSAARDGAGYSLRFEIFPEAEGGDPQWRETVHNVWVHKGVFQVILGRNPDPESPRGSLKDVFDADPRFLETTVLSGPGVASPEPPMRPRIQLLSVLPPETRKEPVSTGGSKGKIIEVYSEGNTTKTVIESKGPLISGAAVFSGEDDLPLMTDMLLSQSGGLYYYGASVAGKGAIRQGDEVRVSPAKRIQDQPSLLGVPMYRSALEDNKRVAEVTAVQGKLAMIDRGTLQKVRERDIYRIFDKTGKARGLLEIGGIGDLQSSGRLYNPLEERGGDAFSSRPGDRAVFIGQRKLFALGLVGGLRSKTEAVFGLKEINFGAGLLWHLTYRDGWGAEVLFGVYDREVTSSRLIIERGPGNNILTIREEQDTRVARYIAPIWLKKNFFYTRPVSPFLAAGFSLFSGKHAYFLEFEDRTVGFPPEITKTDASVKRTAVVPVVGAGLDIFPIRFLRLRFDVRHFNGPRLHAGPSVFFTDSLFYSLGFATGW